MVPVSNISLRLLQPAHGQLSPYFSFLIFNSVKNIQDEGPSLSLRWTQGPGHHDARYTLHKGAAVMACLRVLITFPNQEQT